jgi:hypothetical protein
MDFAAVREAVVAKRNWRLFGDAHEPLLITVRSQAHRIHGAGNQGSLTVVRRTLVHGAIQIDPF